jgi:hypothetical protein
MHHFPLEPDRATMTEMGDTVLNRIVGRTEQLPFRPATSPLAPQATADLVESFLEPPPALGSDLKTLLERLDEAADCALETAGPGHLAYIPGSGLFTAALAEFYNRATNRYGGVAAVTHPATGSNRSAPGFSPAELSWVLAASTMTAMTRPRTSTANARLRPGTRFAASRPVVEAGTPAATWTLCVSSTTRVGSSNRRALSRTWQRRNASRTRATCRKDQWSLIEPVITAWKDRHRSVSGHQGAYAMREIVNAIFVGSGVIFGGSGGGVAGDVLG